MSTYCSTCLNSRRNNMELSSKYVTFINNLLPSLEMQNIMYVCWECRRTLQKIDAFCERVLQAQRLLKGCCKNQPLAVTMNLESHFRLSGTTLTSYDPTDEEDHHPRNDADNEVVAEMNNKEKRTDVGDETCDRMNSHNVDSNDVIDDDDVDDNNQDVSIDFVVQEEAPDLEDKIQSKKGTTRARVGMTKSKCRYRCKICGKIFPSRGRYEYHKEGHGEKPRCELCKKSFISKSVLWTHNNLHHRNVKKYVCDVCHKVFFTEAGHQTHLLMHQEGADAFFCQPCNKFFKSNSSFRKHQRTSMQHAADACRFQCPDCGRRFRSEVVCRHHYDTVHLNVNKVKCPLCPRQYCTERSLKVHVRVKHEHKELPKNKVCEVCGKSFKSTQVLTSHMATHTGARPHVCMVCGARFTQSTALRTHCNRVHMTSKAKGNS